MGKQNKAEEKVSFESFVKKAVIGLRAKNEDGSPKYDGIHTVYSGFNAAARDYFGADFDVIAATNALASEGKIKLSVAKGGAYIVLKADADRLQAERDAHKKAKAEAKGPSKKQKRLDAILGAELPK